MLLKYGGHVNQGDERGDVPLTNASHVGNEEIVLLLIENRANLTVRNFQGFTALHRLLDKEFVQEETIQMFLDSGIDVDDTSNDGSCLLSSAAANSRCEPFQYLLQCGTNINYLLHSNDSLIATCSKGHPNTVKISPERNFPGRTALHKVMVNNNYATAIVKLLLDYGPDVNLKDANGSTPLHEASDWGNHKVVKLLLLHGADVNAKDKDGVTPLHQACDANCEEVVSELLYNGADVNAKYSIYCQVETPLNILVQRQESPLYDENECLRIFVLHIALKILQKQFIDQINIDLINQEVVKYLMEKCNKEIEKMTKMNIRGTSVTLYDFLMKNVVTLSNVIGNKDVQDGFTSDLELEIEFPMYKWYLTWKYSDSLDRFKIIENIMDSFPNNIYPLPHICIHNIFDFLSFQDLQNISQFLSSHCYEY